MPREYHVVSTDDGRVSFVVWTASFGKHFHNVRHKLKRKKEAARMAEIIREVKAKSGDDPRLERV